MKVLIGIDGSEGGWEAVRQATALLAPERDEIALYYSPPKIHLSSARAGQTLVDQVRDKLARCVFDEAISRIPTPLQRRVTTIVGQQNPRQGLRLAADQFHADFVAVGAHGLGATTLLLGRVTRSLLRSSTRPVLVARPAPVRRDRSPYRILWAIDEIPDAPTPCEFLEHVTWPAGASGTLVHVIDPLRMEMPEWFSEKVGHDEDFSKAWSADYDADKKIQFNKLAAFASGLSRPFGGLPLLLEGNSAKTIIDRATEEHADLIIVGTRDLGALERFLIGSTAETILHFAPCSVLVVHLPIKP